MTRRRLDTELVRRGLARSRSHAADLLSHGRVTVDGWPAAKQASMVLDSAAIVVSAGDSPEYASRGAHKLLGALSAFEVDGLRVEGRRCLDAGASTGGFTDVLLRAGAQEVVAVDVGYGQLVWRLRTDPRVRVLDRTNVRHVTPEVIGGRVDLVVADLSFISLRLVLPALLGCLRLPGESVAEGHPDPAEPEALLLVKPQFEVGRERLGKGGVVRDPALRREAVESVAAAAHQLGWGTAGVVTSPLPGPAGNIEYVLWVRRSAPSADTTEIARIVREDP